MQNFDYMTPTRLIFGKESIVKLPEVMRSLGKRVLLTYGGGSIKKIGLYDRVNELLKDFEIFELPGIQPNPKYDPSVLDGVRMCKENQIDVILAVGGGSVLDCSKAIAAGAKYDGDPWDLITYKVKAQAALPIVDVLTLAATGSEYDCGGVISRTETNDKVGYMDPLLFPVCSILDPVYTFTVSKKQTAAGCADAMNHTIEQYFVADSTLLNDGFCESMLKSLMVNATKCIENPEDYTARAEMMLCCTYGCNGILSLGNSYSGWPCHGIEHALSAYYDITHGEGLAIITPRWMRHILNEKTIDRFVKYGINVFGIDATLPKQEIAEKAIDATYAFFESINIPMHLREVGIDESRIDEMAHHIAVNEGLENAYAPLTEEDIKKILIESL
ncbi:iron-containing alcohol dehydrogenase [Pseudoprevotella muciniphila]|uniref:Iron-containing alcohol dehydrogenase n=1 Tax=Pseudoprevotella muciniphila TaxID=2133944 RepID=A0A5P8E4H0_9BACT|nr:iron-containing alcohol dehydrogenase [Pseudoprevotella muciniphila]MBR1941111.1 iron-containing alcohol dehydrogenase [Bacteroidaceae bacterium]QFQ11903.1 iron-containing alcohol dehydrogenase [Pseudoprevotella muciniphila]